jgi:acetyltransferase-like isoleucine patch superfamily enzyme
MRALSGKKIIKQIEAIEIDLGKDVIFEKGVTISGIDGPAKKVIIGDNVFIGRNTTIRLPELIIKDYTKIYGNCLISGYKKCAIGYNCWIDRNCILNSTEYLSIGNNVGIGAYSQLWTHIAFGDLLEGCRFNQNKKMVIGDDVWFGPHCSVSPIKAENKSMALLGSLLTKNMKENHVYGGVPAIDLTSKIGGQFADISIEKKMEVMNKQLSMFYAKNPELDTDKIEIVTKDINENDNRSYFNVKNRKYTKKRSKEEILFMKHLLPIYKFTPK